MCLRRHLPCTAAGTTASSKPHSNHASLPNRQEVYPHPRPSGTLESFRPTPLFVFVDGQSHTDHRASRGGYNICPNRIKTTLRYSSPQTKSKLIDKKKFHHDLKHRRGDPRTGRRNAPPLPAAGRCNPCRGAAATCPPLRGCPSCELSDPLRNRGGSPKTPPQTYRPPAKACRRRDQGSRGVDTRRAVEGGRAEGSGKGGRGPYLGRDDHVLPIPRLEPLSQRDLGPALRLLPRGHRVHLRCILGNNRVGASDGGHLSSGRSS